MEKTMAPDSTAELATKRAAELAGSAERRATIFMNLAEDLGVCH